MKLKIKFLRLFCLTLTAIVALSMGACGKKKIDDSDKTLEISYLDAGYGYKFISEMGEKFKQTHEGVNVVLSKSSRIDPRELIRTGPSNTVDLFIHGKSMDMIAGYGANYVKGYPCALESLDDILDDEVDGVKMMDRFIDGFKPVKVNEHYYSFNWAIGMTGMLYNATIFKNKGYTVPNTTDEMKALCDKIVKDGLVPFTFSAATGYWSYLVNIWYMQYQGVQGVKDFFAGIDDGAYSKEIFKQKGRLVALNTLYDFINRDSGYYEKSCTGQSYTDAQSGLILGEGLMQVNGDWFEHEMRKVSEEDENHYEFKMMKTPVVSVIKDQCTTINDDAVLSKVITYIDNPTEENKTAINGVSEDDINRIREARSCRYSIGPLHQVGIPAYATAKGIAKEFLKFMASEEAQEIYMKCTMGNMLPFKYDMVKHPEALNGMSSFSRSTYELQEKANYYAAGDNQIPDLHAWTEGRENPEIYFTAQNINDRKTPQQIFDEEYNAWSDEKWQHLLHAAGRL